MTTKKFETSEEFKEAVVKEFLPTLQGCTQSRVNYSFPHENICQIEMQNQHQHEVFSIWRKVKVFSEEFGDEEESTLGWCYGAIHKNNGKNIN
jgi:hypothetical protein